MQRNASDRIAPILILGGALAAFPTAAGHFFARDKVTFGGELHVAALERVLAAESTPESVAV